MKPATSAPPPAHFQVATVLCCDLVGSTAKQQPGSGLAPDSVSRGEVFAAARQQLEARARQEMARFGGEDLHGVADNLSGSFANPEHAVVCALALQQALQREPVRLPQGCLQIRGGLHTGPIHRDETNYLGNAGNVAARLHGYADPGGVVASQATKELCAGLESVKWSKKPRRKPKGIKKFITLFKLQCTAKALEQLTPGIIERVARDRQARSLPYRGAVVNGKYTLLDRVNAGAMGEVWQAKQEGLGDRKVAMKFLRADIGENEGQRAGLRQWFADEARTLQQLQGTGEPTGIVNLLDSGIWQPDGDGPALPYLVMPLLGEARPLDQALALRELPVKLECFARVCDAVARVHARRRLHLDLKPDNILVTEKDGQLHPTLVDFGLAAPFHPGVPMPRQCLDNGELRYLAPEQFSLKRGETTRGEISPATDVYAMGVILFELLTTRHPCGLESKRTESAARRAILAGPKLTLAKLCPDLPRVKELSAMLDQALRARSRPPFREVRQLAEALRTVLPKLETSATVPGDTAKPGKTGRPGSSGKVVVKQKISVSGRATANITGVNLSR